jgi:hypothetical protein
MSNAAHSISWQSPLSTAWLLQSSRVIIRSGIIFWTTEEGRHFLDNRKQALRVDFVPLGTAPGGRIKAFVMSDASQHRRVQAKLRDLIERASSAADANLHRRRKPYPSGFAVRANGSKFAFRPEGIEDNDTAVAHIRTLFQHNNVVCYVLTLAAVSKGKQFLLFTAEDEFGCGGGHREIIMQPTPHLGPLEIIDSDFAEGRLVGLLPHQEPSLG